MISDDDPMPLGHIDGAITHTTLSDRQELWHTPCLIRANSLPLAYADTLNPYVADKFRELWQAAQVDEDY